MKRPRPRPPLPEMLIQSVEMGEIVPEWALFEGASWFVWFIGTYPGARTLSDPFCESFGPPFVKITQWLGENCSGQNRVGMDGVMFEHHADALMCFMAWR